MMPMKAITNLVDLGLGTYLHFEEENQGPPFPGFLSDAAIKQFKTKVFETLRPWLWIRYWDDTFAVLKKSKLDEFLTHLNTLVAVIEFTREEDCKTTLLSLDVLITRQVNGSTETSVYRRLKTTGRISNYNRNHPKCHLGSCSSALFHRARTYCIVTEL